MYSGSRKEQVAYETLMREGTRRAQIFKRGKEQAALRNFNWERKM
jgi:hypothetical protein